MSEEKSKTAQQIADEFHANETLSFATHKLTALFKLLAQLGWTIASQETSNRGIYNLYSQGDTQGSSERISRSELFTRLKAGDEKHYLNNSDQLVIWRTVEKKTPQEHVPLTKRESEVYHLLLAGLTLPATAQELGISQRTVEKHVEHLYKKKGVNSYNELLFRS